MTKEFVPYGLAVKLKALGFNEPCFGYYLEDGTWVPASYSEKGTAYPSNTDLLPEWSAAPTYPQAFRWFRGNGKVAEIFSQLLPSNRHKWGFKIQGVEGITDGFLTYEDAELACLVKLVEIEEARI